MERAVNFLISTRTTQPAPVFSINTLSRELMHTAVRDQQTDPSNAVECLRVCLGCVYLCFAQHRRKLPITYLQVLTSRHPSPLLRLFTRTFRTHIACWSSQSIGAVDFLRRLCRRPLKPPLTIQATRSLDFLYLRASSSRREDNMYNHQQQQSRYGGSGSRSSNSTADSLAPQGALGALADWAARNLDPEMQTSPVSVYVERCCHPQPLTQPNLALNLELADYVNQKKANTTTRGGFLKQVRKVNSRNPPCREC